MARKRRTKASKESEKKRKREKALGSTTDAQKRTPNLFTPSDVPF